MSLVLQSVQAREGKRVTWQTQWWCSYVFANKPRLCCDSVSLSHTRTHIHTRRCASSSRMRQHYIISPSSRNHSLVEGPGWQRFRSTGGLKMGHSSIRCWAVCSGAPHWQAGDCRSPQRCMNTPKRPTPVRRQFKDTHFFLGRSAPGGRAVLGAMFRCAGKDTCCQSVIHDSQMSNCEFTSLTACREKGWRGFKRCGPRRFDCSTKSWSRWLGDVKALVTRV